MADRDVNAGHVLTLLVDDGVNRNSRFTGLAVTNDQFALATAHGYHGVNGLQTRLHGLVDRLTGDNTRRNLFDHVGHLGIDRTLAVDGLTQRIDHAAFELGTHWNFQNTAGALDRVAFGDVLVFTQDHGANRVTLQVQGQTVGWQTIAAGREFEHFALHHVGQAMDAANAVSHGNHCALVANVARRSQAFNAALDQFRNFCWIELHDSFLLSLN